MTKAETTTIEGAVTLEQSGSIAEIVMDRPAKHNALTRQMYEQMRQCCERANADDSVHAVIIRGAGERAFCSGSDINALDGYVDFWAWRNRNDYIVAIRAIRKPTIAAVKGWALGGGLEIALACDLRVVAPSAVFGAPEVALGWTGAGGAAQHLTRLAGYGTAMRYLLTGERFDAEEAFRMGMTQWRCESGAEVDKAREVASIIAGHSTVATQAVKAAVRSAMSASVEMGLQIENELMSLCFARNEINKVKAQVPRGSEDE